MSDPLAKLRVQIDAIDDEIVLLLNKRAHFVQEIGEIKKNTKSHFHTPAREAAIYDRLTKNNPGPFPNQSLRHVFREIMGGSLSLEKTIRVAFLGPEATFTHQACLQQFGKSVTAISAPNIKAVFDLVEQGKTDFGIVPVENAIEGMVGCTLDLFVDSPLLIYAEVLHEVSHCVLSKTGQREMIRQIYSHPQAIAQCRRFLDAHFPSIPIVEMASTALAAQRAASDDTAGVIASELAAEVYGLSVIERKIEDYPNNITRFLVISQRASEKTKHNKTSLILSIKDTPGALYEILKPFANAGINLMKIESRPSKKIHWEYLFYLDMEGHQDDAPCRDVIAQIKTEAVFVKGLGSYPIASQSK
ncbi:MAG: prephenate dehydratase [Nitrospirota bacterium]